MSFLALVSTAEFKQAVPFPSVGIRWPVTTYTSAAPELEPLRKRGDLYLVTARPGATLWLVAVLRSPKKTAKGWAARPNVVAACDVTALVKKLRFSDGNGLVAAPGKLEGALLTPRQLTGGDVALLQKLIGQHWAAWVASMGRTTKAPAATSKPPKPKPTPKRRGTTLKPASSSIVALREAVRPALPPVRSVKMDRDRWWETSESDLRNFQRHNHCAAAWLAAGVLVHMARRLEKLEPSAARLTLEAAEALLVLQGEPSAPIRDPLPDRKARSDAEWALFTAMDTAVELARLLADPSNNIPYHASSLVTGMLLTLYATQADWTFDAWLKHAHQVVRASGKRTGTWIRNRQHGLPIPPSLFDAEVTVNPKAFTGYDACVAGIDRSKNRFLAVD